MNKLLKRISGITLGLALCFGFSFSLSDKQSNQMVRADGNSVTYDFTDITGFSSWSSSYGEHTVPYTEGDVYFKSANKQSSTITDQPVTKGNYVTFAFNETYSASYQITSATFVCKQWSNKAQTITLHTSSDGGTTFASTGVTSTNFSITSNSLPDNTNALKITFSSTSNQVGITSLTYEYEPISGGTSYTSYTVTVHYNDGVKPNGTITSSTATGKIAKPSDPTRDGYEFVNWYSDSSFNTVFDFTSVITGDCDMYAKWNKITPKLATPSPVFNKNDKEVTWEAVTNASSYTVVVDNGSPITNATSPYSVASLSSGSHTISVTAIGDGENYLSSDAGSTSFAFLAHAGTEADPYTVADARAATDANEGIKNVYATGIVSEIVTPFSDQYGNISYNISSDGSTESEQLQAYRGKGIGGANFTSADDIQVGDEVVIYGNLKKYTPSKSNNVVYEFDADNQLVSLVRSFPEDLSYITISGDPEISSYTVLDEWSPKGLTVTAYFTQSAARDITSSVEWSYDPASPSVAGIGHHDVDIIASFGGQTNTMPTEFDVVEISYEDDFHLSGLHYIYEQLEENGARYYMSVANIGSNNPNQVPTKAEASLFKFTLVGDNEYTITNEAKTEGLYHKSGNNVSWGSDGKTYKWKVNDNSVDDLYGDYNIYGTSGDESRYLCSFRSATKADWRTYNSINGINRKAKIQLADPATVSGLSVDETKVTNKKVLKGTTFDELEAANMGFEARLNYEGGEYDVITDDATWTLETSIANSNATLYVSYKSYGTVEVTGINVYAPAMASLTLNTDAVKKSYIVGDVLDVSGITITGTDTSNEDHAIEVGQCTFSPANGTILTSEDTTVTVTYPNDGNPVSASYSITVVNFVGYTKVTSANDLEVGATYVIGVDASNPTYKLMGSIASTTDAKSLRNAVDASSVMSTDATKVLDTASSVAGAATFTLFKNEAGQYAFYDLGVNKYLAGFTNDGDNHLNNVDSLGNTTWWNISFSSNVMSVTLKDTNRVLAYNYNNGNDRFATYGGYSASIPHIALFKIDDSALKVNVRTFANDWLKMNDDNYVGDIETPNCSENYEFLKIAYGELSDLEKNVLQYANEFVDARARLVNWATANHETFTYGAENPFEAISNRGILGRSDILSNDSKDSVLIVFMIATLGASTLSAVYLIKRKKKEQ